MVGLRWLKSTARLMVAKVLTTSSTGFLTSGLHSDTTIPAPYLPSLTTRAEPLPDQLLPITFWYSPSTEGSGTQTRDTPCGHCSSTRVVISNVRQPDGFGSKGSCWAKPRRG